MAATVLNTRRAVEVPVYVVRAFVKLRELVGIHRELTSAATPAISSSRCSMRCANS